jgi:hypothetical protein
MNPPVDPVERYDIAARVVAVAYAEEMAAGLQVAQAGGALRAPRHLVELWIQLMRQYARAIEDLLAAQDAILGRAPATPEQIAARERAWAEVQ